MNTPFPKLLRRTAFVLGLMGAMLQAEDSFAQKKKKKGALGLGYVSMYNHNYNANCEYEMDYDENTIAIKTIKKINAGEELFINYNATPDDASPVWFDAK
jgi:SET domain-containing protein